MRLATLPNATTYHLVMPMSLNSITREAVLEAIAEYDRLGQEEFLHRYGFDRARQYVLVHDGKHYDSKAIVGVAHGFLPGRTALTASKFSGGRATVGQLLARLGFNVENGDEEPLGLPEPVETSPAVASLAERAAEYKRLCMRVDVFWRDRDDTRAERTASLPVRATSIASRATV
jgi:hypothetical protein